MGFKFWAQEKLTPPTNGEWYLGADYQQYLTSDHPGNFVAFDVVRRTMRWRAVSPAPFWAGAVATPPDSSSPAGRAARTFFAPR
jgi:hypothetical protein